MVESDYNNEFERRVWVYDLYSTQDREFNWQFNYVPDVDSEALKELTKHCHIQNDSHDEYAYTVEVNGNTYYYSNFGIDNVILMCMLCIMLDNQKLETILRSSQTENAKNMIERLRFPKTGPFYFYKGWIRAFETHMRVINPDTRERGRLEIDAGAGEHRDLWDRYMLEIYPELTEEYNADDHKSMPRGRVDCKTVNGKLTFWVTLDKCIKGKEYEIQSIFYLKEYDVEFHYGTINYKCKHCR